MSEHAVPDALQPATEQPGAVRSGRSLVLNRLIVFSLLGAFITAVYVGIVVGVGSVLGTDRPGTTLSILATGVAAVAFQPARTRVQRLANRLVYGERATPYEIMASFGRSLAASLSLEDVLPQMAKSAALGIDAAAAQVSVHLPGGGSGSARWPADDAVGSPPPASWDGRIAVMHQGEVVGDIAVAKPAGEDLTQAERRLLSALAEQAGLALRNVGLAAELRARLEEIAAQADELRASRQRIVAAQDAERRRMERKVHDGAQQELAALAVKLRLAQQLLERDPAQAETMLVGLSEQASATLDELRDLARGIYPPLLADQGLLTAVRAQLRKHDAPVELDAEPALDGIRFEEQAESTAYFCCVEALANAAAHAPHSPVHVLVRWDGVALELVVRDEGPGFDPESVGDGGDLQSMIDHVEALGGTLHISSAPGQGTTVTVRIPTHTRVASPHAAASVSGAKVDFGT